MGFSRSGYQHILSRYSSNGYARRSRKAAALLVTVLITVAAATITLLLVKQALDIARSESNKSATRGAQLLVENLRAEFETKLEANPFFFYDRVDEKEPARVCTHPDGTETPVNPGASWPRECGASWTYSPAGRDKDSYLEITPPGENDSLLRVKYAARLGVGASGLDVHYLLGEADGPLLADTNSFDIGKMADAAQPSELSGTIYSGGTLSYTPGAVTLSHARLLGEFGVPSPSSGVSSSATATSTPSIRDYMSSPVTRTSIKASQDQLATLACGQLESSSLCLKEGTQLIGYADANDGDPSNDTPITVPSAKAWMILPSATPGALDVYFMIQDWHAALPSSCTGDCTSYWSAASDAVTNGTHPGVLTSWTQLGTFAYPSSGLLYTPTETHLGICGSGTDPNPIDTTPCDNPLSEYASNLTFVVGSSSSPADLFLSGSVAPASGRALGAAVSGRVALPYWAHPSGVPASYTVALKILNASKASTSFYQYPSDLGNASSNPEALDAQATFLGSITGTGVGFPLSQYFSASFKEDPRLLESPAPYVSSGPQIWSALTTNKLDASDLVLMLQR